MNYNDNPFENMVNSNSDLRRDERIQDDRRLEEERIREERLNKQIRIYEESQRKNRRKKEKRRKTIFKTTLAIAIAASVGFGALVMNGSKNIRNKGYASLNESDCYMRYDLDTNRDFIAFDGEALYGSINPNYREVQPGDNTRVYDILISEGYSNEEAMVILYELRGVGAVKEASNDRGVSVSPSDFLGVYIDNSVLNSGRSK